MSKKKILCASVSAKSLIDGEWKKVVGNERYETKCFTRWI